MKPALCFTVTHRESAIPTTHLSTSSYSAGSHSHRASPWKSLSFTLPLVSHLHFSPSCIKAKTSSLESKFFILAFPKPVSLLLSRSGAGATFQGRNGKLGFLLGTRCAKLRMLTLHILLFFVLRTSQLQAAGNSTGQVTWFLQQLTGEWRRKKGQLQRNFEIVSILLMLMMLRPHFKRGY